MGSVQVNVTGGAVITVDDMEKAIAQARNLGMNGEAKIAWNLFGGVTITGAPDTKKPTEVQW